VNVFAWVDGDTIHVESKFSGGKKVKEGKVVVMDRQGVELHSGMTNDQGEYAFKVPQKSDLRIVIIAGQGHQGAWTVRETELQAETPEARAAKNVEKLTMVEQNNAVPRESEDPGGSIKPEDLEAVVESVLDRKLKPITGMLADLQQKGPSVGDIFAGIGYILGLVGIATYARHRKQKD
jgi:nickel transport protein